MDFQFRDHNIYNENIGYKTLRCSFLANHKFNTSHMVRIGAIFSDEYYNFYSAGYNFDLRRQDTVFNNKGNTYVFQSFLECYLELD